MSWRVECIREKPETVYRATEDIAFVCCQESAIGEVGLPLFEREDIFPFLCNAADLDNLRDKSG
jgi:hypothetical protein